jgi:hypothetical protein
MDETKKYTKEELEEAKSQAINTAKLDTVLNDVKQIKEMLELHYVKQDEFKPVKTIVYGMVGTILLAVMSSLILLIMKTPQLPTP